MTWVCNMCHKKGYITYFNDRKQRTPPCRDASSPWCWKSHRSAHPTSVRILIRDIGGYWKILIGILMVYWRILIVYTVIYTYTQKKQLISNMYIIGILMLDNQLITIQHLCSVLGPLEPNVCVYSVCNNAYAHTHMYNHVYNCISTSTI